MDSGEAEAAQPEEAVLAPDEEMQRLADAWDAAQERELSRIDKALDDAKAADSRESAVAALTRATVGINALYVSARAVPPIEIISPQFDLTRRSSLINPSIFLFHPRNEDSDRKRDERIEKYLKVASELVEKWKPDQYQVSAGFPLLISITLTWNLK